MRRILIATLVFSGGLWAQADSYDFHFGKDQIATPGNVAMEGGGFV